MQESDDAVQLLIQQHRRLEALMESALDEDNEAERKRLFLEAADHLTVHIKSEEVGFD